LHILIGLFKFLVILFNYIKKEVQNMKAIVSGNWKMNGSKNQIDEWFKTFFNSVNEYKGDLNVEKVPTVLICVPAIYIDYAQKVANEYNSKSDLFKVYIGSEDCHYEDKGAFTGNTSPVFLQEFGCKYAIVGHSERRQYQKETDELVAKKAKKVLEAGMTPLVCIGESLEIREAGDHFKYIGEQVIKSTEGVDLNKAVVAYEPIWAIGTGKVPSEKDINDMCDYIKDVLVKARGIKKEDLKVLYGGSVKSSNSDAILHMSQVNGVLVGGASLKGDEFFKIAISSL
jgi:triosephosphate isomerase